jgi:hypothetical protein
MCNKSIICGVSFASGAITFYEGNNMLSALKKYMINRLMHGLFHIALVISPRLISSGLVLITRTIWTRNVCITKYDRLYKTILLSKILFIVMVTLTFDLMTPKYIWFFPFHRGIMWPSLLKIRYTELKLSCGNDPVVKNSIYSNGDLDLWLKGHVVIYNYWTCKNEHIATKYVINCDINWSLFTEIFQHTFTFILH